MFAPLEAPARAKVCKGMAGLIEEGEEVISGRQAKRTSRRGSRVNWGRTTGRALRNRSLYYGAKPRGTDAQPYAGAVADRLPRRGTERLPVARSAGAAVAVRGADARGG